MWDEIFYGYICESRFKYLTIRCLRLADMCTTSDGIKELFELIELIELIQAYARIMGLWFWVLVLEPSMFPVA